MASVPRREASERWVVSNYSQIWKHKRCVYGISNYEDDAFKWNLENEVIAWAELPEPYKEEKGNEEKKYL